jgi:transposase-like protein
MAVIPDFKSATLFGFLKENAALGSTVYTDGLKSFAGLQQAGLRHVPRPQPLRIDLRKAAFGRPRHWESPAMANRNLSRREPRSASGLS